jgi:hypothetical protein
MDWERHGELGGSYRNIRKFSPDKNGYFNFTFHASDLELRNNGGYHIRYIDSDNKFVDLSSGYEEYPTLGTISIQRRDTMVNKIFWLPRRSHIRIKILNPALETYCYVGFKARDIDSEVFNHHHSGWITSKEQTEEVMEAAGNQWNYLDIYKKIKGNTIMTEDSIYVSLGDTTLYEIK